MGVIDELAAKLVQARHAEAEARTARVEAEEALIAQIELGEQERKTLKTDNGLKLTFQSGLSYKLAKGCNAEAVPVKRTEKIDLDTKAYEALRESDPETFKDISQYVTVTPKKTSVSVAIL